VKLPEGAWDKLPLTWAKDHHSGLLYTADANGNLFSFDEEHGFSAPLGRTLLAPVGPMAVTHDGRVFGFCGPEMAKMFCYNPATHAVTNLGVAVSVLESRRYGYVFGDAVTVATARSFSARTMTLRIFGFIFQGFRLRAENHAERNRGLRQED